MLKVSVWNPKGGVGKTTLAMNLAAAIMGKGKTVILADLDPQQSAMMMARDRNLPFEVVAEIPKGGVDVVVLDHPPGYVEPPRAQVLIFPMRLARPDMQAGIKALKSLGKDVKKAVVVFNDIDFRRGVERSTWNAARKMDAFRDARLVKSRTVYRVALDKGRTVFDEVLDRYHAAQEARIEIQNILKK
jgi:chromosome partitioning protein